MTVRSGVGATVIGNNFVQRKSARTEEERRIPLRNATDPHADDIVSEAPGCNEPDASLADETSCSHGTPTRRHSNNPDATGPAAMTPKVVRRSIEQNRPSGLRQWRTGHREAASTI